MHFIYAQQCEFASSSAYRYTVLPSQIQLNTCNITYSNVAYPLHDTTQMYSIPGPLRVLSVGPYIYLDSLLEPSPTYLHVTTVANLTITSSDLNWHATYVATPILLFPAQQTLLVAALLLGNKYVLMLENDLNDLIYTRQWRRSECNGWGSCINTEPNGSLYCQCYNGLPHPIQGEACQLSRNNVVQTPSYPSQSLCALPYMNTSTPFDAYSFQCTCITGYKMVYNMTLNTSECIVDTSYVAVAAAATGTTTTTFMTHVQWNAGLRGLPFNCTYGYSYSNDLLTTCKQPIVCPPGSCWRYDLACECPNQVTRLCETQQLDGTYNPIIVVYPSISPSIALPSNSPTTTSMNNTAASTTSPTGSHPVNRSISIYHDRYSFVYLLFIPYLYMMYMCFIYLFA